MVDGALIARRVERLRGEELGAVAVVPKGSYARGEAELYSDLDFDLLTAGAPRVEYPVYLAESAGGRLIHVSVATQSLEAWLTGEDELQG